MHAAFKKDGQAQPRFLYDKDIQKSNDKLETKFVKSKTSENLKLYRKQRNVCSKLYKNERRKYHEKLDD